MIYSGVIKGKNIILRPVMLSDCNERYLAWLNDENVNRYLETRWIDQTIESIKDFVISINNSDHSYLFAIIINENNHDKHIGNIKIGPIDKHYLYADISYFIGDKDYWGKGIATEAIKMISRFGFETLKLNRIQAGSYGRNTGSIRALEKAGFQLEGCFRKQYNTGQEIDDHLYFGILKEEMI